MIFSTRKCSTNGGHMLRIRIKKYYIMQLDQTNKKNSICITIGTIHLTVLTTNIPKPMTENELFFFELFTNYLHKYLHK